MGRSDAKSPALGCGDNPNFPFIKHFHTPDHLFRICGVSPYEVVIVGNIVSFTLSEAMQGLTLG